MIDRLRDAGYSFLPEDVDWNAYQSASDSVHRAFEVPATSITRQMRLLLFALGNRWPEPNILGLGTYVGYAAAWIWSGVRARHGDAASLEGYDIDEEACKRATQNFRAAFGEVNVAFECRDASRPVVGSQIGILYIDVDSALDGKWGYITGLLAQYHRLRRPALVIAHDAVVAKFNQELRAFTEVLRDDVNFVPPVVLPIDRCGLLLSQFGQSSR